MSEQYGGFTVQTILTIPREGESAGRGVQPHPYLQAGQKNDAGHAYRQSVAAIVSPALPVVATDHVQRLMDVRHQMEQPRQGVGPLRGRQVSVPKLAGKAVNARGQLAIRAMARLALQGQVVVVPVPMSFHIGKSRQTAAGTFKAGINLYGVSNQFDFEAGGTHKFEEHYNHTLLGPFPEAADIYRERSPIFFVDKIRDPIAVFQGEDDIVVPRRHSDEVVKSLERRGVPHVYHIYPGEGHGFSKPETIEHFYTEVEKFLRQYVILT